MLLQTSGYRMTAPRWAVLSALDMAGGEALDIQTVWSIARRRHPRLGKATVYRMLERLEALGLVRRIHDQCGCHAFVAVGDNQGPLLVCLRCSRTLAAPAPVLAEMSDLLLRECGFQISPRDLQISAICPECR
jgi:Fe2+ or Zn2+ uptake regulation protein